MATHPINRAHHPRPSPIEQPILAFVDCDIAGGQAELAREQLIQRGVAYQSSGVAPLFVAGLRERGDLRMACMVRDLAAFNDFMIDEVRRVEGVRETRTTLTFGGWAELDILLELEMEVTPSTTLPAPGTLPNLATGVWINVEPGMDRACFAALRAIPPHPDVRQVWLLHCYQSHDSDLSLLLLGKSSAALAGYVMSWVRTAPGVLNTEMGTIHDWQWLAKDEDLVELCALFFKTGAAPLHTIDATPRAALEQVNPPSEQAERQPVQR